MGTSLASDLVEWVRQLLLSGATEAFDLVDASGISATPATGLVTFNVQLGTSGVGKGARFTVDLEEFICTSVSTLAVTGLRAMAGTTAAAHAANALLRVNPKVTDFNILRELNSEINDLGSPANGLYQDPLPFVDLTKSAGVQGYDLPEIAFPFLGVYRITYNVLGISNDWPEVQNWRQVQALPTSGFASGNGLMIYDDITPGRTMRVHYKAGFGQLASLTDNVTGVTGLPTTMADIAVLGVADKLSSTREAKRDFIENQPGRNPQEVPAGAMLGASRAYAVKREARISAERARLSRLYPIKQKW